MQQTIRLLDGFCRAAGLPSVQGSAASGCRSGRRMCLH